MKKCSGGESRVRRNFYLWRTMSAKVGSCVRGEVWTEIKE